MGHHCVVNERELILPGLSKQQFGQHTRALRLAIGLDVADLAQRAELEPSLVERIEAGEAELNADMMATIAFGLGMTPWTFIRLWEVGRLRVE